MKGVEEVSVVMPTDTQSTAEPVEPVAEGTSHQSETEEHKENGKLWSLV